MDFPMPWELSGEDHLVCRKRLNLMVIHSLLELGAILDGRSRKVSGQSIGVEEIRTSFLDEAGCCQMVEQTTFN